MPIVALRVSPGLVPTVYPTDPFPVELAPLVMVSQGALLAALQGHPLTAVTTILPFVAGLLTVMLGGAIASTVQADWFTVTLPPPIVIVANLGVASLLGDTEMMTGPLPLPLDPEMIVAQELSLVAFHVHPFAAMTGMV